MKLKVFISDSNIIIRQGLKAIIDAIPGVGCVGMADSSGELLPMVINASPDVIFVNYSSPLMLDDDVETILRTLPYIKVIGITDRPKREWVIKYLQKGIAGHLLYSCDAEEVRDSIFSVAKNERFFLR